jgi:hypothetical protein
MALSEAEKTEFINSYTRALVTSWSSEEYSQRLGSDPRAALAEVGLEVPAKARIDIVRTIPEETDPDAANGHLDRQVALWQVGVDTGYFQVYIPDTPQVDTADLALDELADVAGGLTPEVGDINCCCCPCSCCT